jgi:hypothetical protein
MIEGVTIGEIELGQPIHRTAAGRRQRFTMRGYFSGISLSAMMAAMSLRWNIRPLSALIP